jgi:uncharacterized repeat protein (TIGR03806 family)
MKKSFIFILILFAVGLCYSFSGKTIKVFDKKDKLSAYGFFKGRLSDLVPADEVVPYDLNTALFSNYAEKLRFIKVPEGKKVIYNDSSWFVMPVGTVLIKNFYFHNDMKHPEKGRKIMETRLLVLEENGWNAYPYIWNDEQTEAFYDVAGEKKTITYKNEDGKIINTHYLIPNKNQCKGCHLENKKMVPVGIAARHLNKSFSYSEQVIANQLQHWKSVGILSGLPDDPGSVPANALWQNKAEGLEKRARSYLDINCGSCHNPKGPASTSGFFLDIRENNLTALGVYKTPVAAGQGSGGFKYDILPGKPEQSILVYRMKTNDPGKAMPEIGREQLHKEGITLISEWIREMKDPK